MSMFAVVNSEGILDDSDEGGNELKTEEKAVDYAKRLAKEIKETDDNSEFKVVKVLGVVKREVSPFKYTRI